jgi:DNA-binding MarR family transcriptional regulator
MLVLRGWPEDGRASIGDLAQQLLIKHNSAVELVDRLVEEKLVVREPSRADRRKVELRLTGRGRQVLAKLAAMHRAELERLGPFLTRFFNDLPQLGTALADKAAS